MRLVRAVEEMLITHEIGDTEYRVFKLGHSFHQREHGDKCREWSFGPSALMKNLAGRGLI
ncbi:fumarylacetoacetate (FAA) hydrolase family protein [Neorhizobium galegae]|nr:fumarylacetoacetate (FAA) hydrolase family protein [Neorhizobium galegae]